MFPLKKHGHCPFICPIDVLLIVCTIVADYCQETTTAKKHKKANNNKRKKQEAEKIKSQNPEEPRSQTGKQHKKIKIEPITNQFHSYRNMIRTNKTSITSIAKNAFCIYIYIYNNANYIYIYTLYRICGNYPCWYWITEVHTLWSFRLAGRSFWGVLGGAMVRTTIATIVTTRAHIEYPQNPKETAETVLTLPFPSLDMFSLFFSL